jgi:hypothetical protein
MTIPEYKKIVAKRTSYTQDEIVAKMIGWLRGPIHPKNIEITHSYFTEDQLIHLTELEVSLTEHLTQLLNAAYEDYSKCGDDVPYYIAIAKEEEIERIEELSKKAFAYGAAFAHELMLGQGCMLAKDEDSSEKLGENCYTIISAEKWAQSKYSISIVNYVDPKCLSIEDGLVVPRDYDSDGFNKTVVNNFYITFALLIEAFIEADPNYAKRIEDLTKMGENWQSESSAASVANAKIIVSNLGQYLSIRSKIPGSRKFGKGQSDEAIMTHVKNALNYKAKVWEARKVPSRRK